MQNKFYLLWRLFNNDNYSLYLIIRNRERDPETFFCFDKLKAEYSTNIDLIIEIPEKVARFIYYRHNDDLIINGRLKDVSFEKRIEMYRKGKFGDILRWLL